MMRDPRAVVASHRDWNKLTEGADAQEAERTRRTYDPTLLSALWRVQVPAGRQAASNHPGSVMIQRYGDLVVKPETAVRALADFVGVEFSPEIRHVPHNRLTTIGQLARAPYRAVQAVASNRGRMGNPASYIAKRVRALVGI